MVAVNRRELYGILKTAVLIVGILVLIIGCHAFFESQWNRSIFRNLTDDMEGQIYVGANFFEACNRIDTAKANFLNHSEETEKETFKDKPIPAKRGYFNCPTIETALEYYFIVIIILTFILSVVSLAFGLFAGDNVLFKRGDPFYQIAAGGLLLIGGIINIVSATRIDEFLTEKISRRELASRNGFEYQRDLVPKRAGYGDFDEAQFLRGKLAAGSFAIINSVVYIVAGVVGLKLD